MLRTHGSSRLLAKLLAAARGTARHRRLLGCKARRLGAHVREFLRCCWAVPRIVALEMLGEDNDRITFGAGLGANLGQLLEARL